MFFFTCTLAAILAAFVAASPTPPMDPVDALANRGLDNKIAYEKSQRPMSNKTCTVENAVVRREW